jgi:hypothetical protein
MSFERIHTRHIGASTKMTRYNQPASFAYRASVIRMWLSLSIASTLHVGCAESFRLLPW